MNPGLERPSREPIQVGDLMSRIVHTTTEMETVREAHATMRMSRIRHLPVLDARGDLIGVVSDRDLYLGWSRSAATPVSEVMTRNLQWVHPTTPALQAAERMLHDKIGCLPVVDESQKLVGIITDTDFLEVAHRALTLSSALRLEEASCGSPS